MVNHDPPETAEQLQGDDGTSLTRRTALSLLGAGGVGAMMAGSAAASHDGPDTDEVRPWNQHVDAKNHDLFNLHSIDVEHVHTAARDADVVVWKDEDGVYHADSTDEHIASGEDFIGVTQAAVDSLTNDRDWKEKVAVVSPATITADQRDGNDDLRDGPGVELPSYTILDVPASITVENEGGEPWAIPVRAQDAHHVEIPNLTVRGSPRYVVMMNTVSNVYLGNIDIELDDTGIGIRIDAGGDADEPENRSSDIQVDRIYAEGVDYHAFETRGVDRLQVNQILGKNINGCVVLLNESSDATINSIIEYSPDIPAHNRYATFRSTYQQGRVAISDIVSHSAGRGLHIHSGSGEITISNVYIDGARNRGAVLSGPPNTVLNGGVIKNCTGKAIDLYNTNSPVAVPERRADGVTIANMRIYDDRPEEEREQTAAINEGGTAQNNRFVNNDVRDGGTEALIDTASPTTVVQGNVGDGVASGTVTLESGSDPAARVEDVSSHSGVTLELRSKTFDAPSSAFGYDHYFEWTGSQWDLVFEWRTDPGENLTVDYIVDRPQANIGRFPLEEDRDYDDTIDTPDVPDTDAPVTDGMVMHLDANVLSHLDDGSGIEAWPDRSDVGNYGYQGTEESRPVYSTDAMGGSPAVQFSRADETYMILNEKMVTVGDLTLFIVGQWTGSMDKETYLIGAAQPNRLRIANYGNWDGQNVLAWRVGDGNVAFADPDTEPHVFAQDSSMNVYHDGQKAPEIEDENTITDAYPNELTLGARRRGTDFIDANVAEVLLFERELSEDEVEQVNQYLADKHDAVTLG
ncbi:hypothetical protein [Halomontanus rarus]|uniref:hypothetical protein n=1 Tax=Halomontanus rarus TaxID=3034020 RepID=UPI001A998769